jgi:hypothetical protein
MALHHRAHDDADATIDINPLYARGGAPQSVPKLHLPKGELPPSLARRDSQRLKALGYWVTSESVTAPFITHDIPGRGGGRTIKHRVPMCRVRYGRRGNRA